ncbi:MAG: hypothetical protein OIF48_12670 [Silicimonas sp.]|nr:hypothetical protein [Silicimonas sp.]
MISAGLVLFAGAGALSAASFSFQPGAGGYTDTSDTELQEIFADLPRGASAPLFRA